MKTRSSLRVYEAVDGRLSYSGTDLFPRVAEVRRRRPPSDLPPLTRVHEQARIEIFDTATVAATEYMRDNLARFVELPMLTRMISSPGALNGRIPTDVPPFALSFFGREVFLSQSSQIYLELALASTDLERVYTLGKSFRREEADFRHLPEFTHVEYESNVSQAENQVEQIRFLREIVRSLIARGRDSLRQFLSDREIDALGCAAERWKVETISFHDAFELLRAKSDDPRYATPSAMTFGCLEEVLVTEEFGDNPVFVTDYLSDEVAFYHANHADRPELAVCSDLLYPGFGEIIGSGERIRTLRETRAKVKHFDLVQADYEPYIASRVTNGERQHSGWGMGFERFIQCVLKLPYIWLTKPFPQVGRVQPEALAS